VKNGIKEAQKVRFTRGSTTGKSEVPSGWVGEFRSPSPDEAEAFGQDRLVQPGAQTGRTSTKTPNLSNPPKKLEG